MAKDKNEYGITVEEAVSELNTQIESAVDFISSEFEDDWAKAERYFAGMSDLPTTVGRSTVVKTETRDAIRALKPSVMRTFLHARKIVEYTPSTINGAALAEQQSEYVAQIFWANDGYKQLMSCFDEAAKKKIGPIKTYWVEDPRPEYMKMTHVTAEDVAFLEQDEDIELTEVSEVPADGDVQLYDVEGYKYFPNGRIIMEAFSSSEFFVSRNANDIDDAVVHGHRRTVTVEEALAMGLEYDEWDRLDDDDPEQNEFASESWARRGYQKQDEIDSKDITKHEFLLTECYAEFDLEGEGRPKKYVFWLGGSSYRYLGHDEVDEWCIDVVQIDPVPFTVIGHSIADVTMQEQDTETSLLRAIVDNAHMANNPRHAANPLFTDFNDLMNNAIGAPIKNKAGGQIDTIDIPFTGQALLPLLQYLEQDVQNKVGVTKAATGLDPDAMQSTDKDAVRNTIALGQGQVELIVRNIIETGLIGVFSKLLKLSARHMDRMQVIRSKGLILPVNTMLFDASLVATPKLGLGTTSPEVKMGALNFVLAKQEQIIQQFGMDNPFTSLSKMYNTLEDLVELSGLSDVGRYFTVVTPEIEQKLAQQQAEAAKKAKEEGTDNTPMDPAKAMMVIEGGKAQLKQAELTANSAESARKLELDALRLQEDSDYKRDKLTQDRVLKLAEIQEKGRAARADAQIRKLQATNPKLNTESNSGPETDTTKPTNTGSNQGGSEESA